MALIFLYVGIAVWIAIWVGVSSYSWIAQKQTLLARKQMIFALFTQDVAWFDQNGIDVAASVLTWVTTTIALTHTPFIHLSVCVCVCVFNWTLTNGFCRDTNRFQEGLGDKLATAIQFVATFVAGLIVGFVKGWQLTLVILACIPAIGIAGFAVRKTNTFKFSLFFFS
jgi:ABC-type multidrug transport system fused ATPase/permease subunit